MTDLTDTLADAIIGAVWVGRLVYDAGARFGANVDARPKTDDVFRLPPGQGLTPEAIAARIASGQPGYQGPYIYPQVNGQRMHQGTEGPLGTTWGSFYGTEPYVVPTSSANAADHRTSAPDLFADADVYQAQLKQAGIRHGKVTGPGSTNAMEGRRIERGR